MYVEELMLGCFWRRQLVWQCGCLGSSSFLLRALTRALALSSEAKQYVRRPRAFVSSFLVNYESVG